MEGSKSTRSGSEAVVSGWFSEGSVVRETRATAGTYVLVFRCRVWRRVVVGRLGEVTLEPGWYVYVGSAFGPGGVRARVARHRRREKAMRWHIDYVRPHLALKEVWASYGQERLECEWARALGELPGSSAPLKGMGASDCACAGHFLKVAYGENLVVGI